MGHYLATVNPDAAAAIGASEQEPLPSVGEIVVYTCRAGYGRSGRREFPALVMGHTDNDTLALVVIFDAGDMIDETLVDKGNPNNLDSGHFWEWRERERPVAQRLEEPAGMRGVVADLDKAVFGDFDRPKISIIDIMQDFERRLRALKETNTELAERLEKAESALAAANVGPRGKRGK